MRALTLTNNTSVNVNAKHIHSTADLFFIPKYTSEQTFCTFLVANFYVDLSAIDTADVRPVAQALLKCYWPIAKRALWIQNPSLPWLLNSSRRR